MKILLLAPQPFYSERGTPIAILNLLRALSGQGHQIDLITYPGGQDVEVENCRIIRTWKIPFTGQVPVGFSISKVLYDGLMMGVALYQSIKNRYQVIHANEEAIYIGMLCAPLKRSKLVYDMDSSMSDQLIEKWPSVKAATKVFDWFEALAIKRSSRVVAVCDALAEKAQEYNSSTPVDVLEDIIMPSNLLGDEPPIDQIKQLIPNANKLLLYVGNLEHYQGIDLVIEAMASQQIPKNLSFMVVGGMVEQDLQRCLQLAQSLGVDDKVVFAGARPVSQLMDYLAQADCLISPRTKGVNTPMKIYSYMGAAKPIIATNIFSHTQVLHDGIACLVEADSESIASGINRVIGDVDYATQLAQQAQKEAVERFSYDAFKHKLKTIYQQLES